MPEEESIEPVKAYTVLCSTLGTASLEDLTTVHEFLEDVQDKDWGPGGELARSVQEHVSFLIEDRKRGF